MPPHCDTMDGPVVKAATKALDAYFAEIGRLFGVKTAGCSGKSATPCNGAGPSRV